MSKLNYLHVIGRMFNTPLLIDARHFAPIANIVGSRAGLDFEFPMEAAVPEGALKSQSFIDAPDNVAVIEVSGPLVRRASGLDAMCGMVGYERIEKQFIEALADDNKEAILMCFDSPGGEVGGLFDLTDLIYSSRGEKPIIASVSEMAFSAAYALASACDRIIVTRTAGVGSVGVFTAHCDQSDFNEKIGVKVTYIFAGKKKVDGNPNEPLSDEARANIQEEVDRSYSLFVSTVARNRKVKESAVRKTEAALYFGDEGVDADLADEVGTPKQALDFALAEVAAKKAKAKVEAPARSSAQANSEQPATEMSSLAAQPEQTPATEQSESNLTKEALMAKKEEEMPESKKQKEKDEEEEAREGNKEGASQRKESDGEDSEKNKEEEGEEEARKAKRKAAKKKASEEQEESEKECADPKQVVMLCKLAGRPEAAADFIENGSTIFEVQEALVKWQAEQHRGQGAIGTHVAMIGKNSTDQLDSLAKARAASTGKPYADAYIEVLKANPKLYTSYLDQKDAALGIKR